MIVKLEHVYWVREKEILKDISWTVEKGSHWVLFGPNGSGKTTILQMINGYTWPSRGEITVLGHKFGTVDLRELRKQISWVSSYLQDRLYVNETVRKIVLSGKFASIGLYDKITPKDIEQAEAALDMVEMAHLSKQVYSRLSQGEKQKALIARALINSPKLLILDEPCSGLDVFSRENLLKMIEKISRQDSAPTIIYVTHHVEEILPVFTNVLLLKAGQVFMSGPTRSILTGSNLTEFFNHPVSVKWHNNRANLIID